MHVITSSVITGAFSTIKMWSMVFSKNMYYTYEAHWFLKSKSVLQSIIIILNRTNNKLLTKYQKIFSKTIEIQKDNDNRKQFIIAVDVVQILLKVLTVEHLIRWYFGKCYGFSGIDVFRWLLYCSAENQIII